jgi:hypothetical protein
MSELDYGQKFLIGLLRDSDFGSQLEMHLGQVLKVARGLESLRPLPLELSASMAGQSLREFMRRDLSFKGIHVALVDAGIAAEKWDADHSEPIPLGYSELLESRTHAAVDWFARLDWCPIGPLALAVANLASETSPAWSGLQELIAARSLSLAAAE